MNILFVNYGGLKSNSFNHLSAFYIVLSNLGHSCVIALHGSKETIKDIELNGIITLAHEETFDMDFFFPNGKSADIIHAWTPRISVLETVLLYQQRCVSHPRLVVHLEDNERHLLSDTAGVTFEALENWSDKKLSKLLQKGLCHPIRHQLLLAAADLVTGITPSLSELSPYGVPFATLYPGLDLSQFSPKLPDIKLREKLGIGANYRIIIYPGGANHTNAAELQSLYSAVAILNARGIAVKLVRSGPPTSWFTAKLTEREKENSIELGYVDRDIIPELLSLADVLVQPGKRGPYNNYRLPSKIPEFLASGRPVILPATNIAHSMKDECEALFLYNGSPDEIANLCERIFSDPALALKLGTEGRKFACAHFDVNHNGRYLEGLYKVALNQPIAANWSGLKNTGYDESYLFPLVSKRALTENILLMAKKRRTSYRHRLNEIRYFIIRQITRG